MGTVLVVAGTVVVLFGLAAVVITWFRGDLAVGQLRDESRETRRAVRHALRDGGTDDAEIDRLARHVIRSTPGLRWAKYLFGTMLALSILQLAIGPYTAAQIVAHSAQAALFAALILLDLLNRRRLARYRGLAVR